MVSLTAAMVLSHDHPCSSHKCSGPDTHYPCNRCSEPDTFVALVAAISAQPWFSSQQLQVLRSRHIVTLTTVKGA
eukprot:1149062-Pelagomonas_calceolata.AAC.7